MSLLVTLFGDNSSVSQWICFQWDLQRCNVTQIVPADY